MAVAGFLQRRFRAKGMIGHQESTISVEQERRLFEDGLFYHSDKKAKFLFEAPRDVPEVPDEEYPFVLLTGRGTSSQWHTQTRTGKSAVLKKLYPDHIYVEMNPLDAESLGIEANQKVHCRVQAGRGDRDRFHHKYGPSRAAVYPDALFGCERTHISRPLIRTHGSLPTKPAPFL